MAEVFEAVVQGEAGFERRVVIKRLLKELADEANHQSFVDEAKVASYLHHNNIVSVIDFGVMDGLPFQVLELVDGMSANRLVQDHGPVSPEVGLYITMEIAHALNYAHTIKNSRGEPLQVVHRDVSPENILLSRFGDVKLADFGIATFAHKGGTTRVGVAKGKLGYMAPEQFRGERVDARTDIFSLGCVLHELVAGESPLAKPEHRKGVLAYTPAPLDSELPEDVRRIVERAIAPSPDDRFERASRMASACAKALGARQLGDGRALIVEELEMLEDETLQATPEIEAHPLNSLMQVELVLQETNDGVRTFHTVVGPNPLQNSTQDQAPEPEILPTRATEVDHNLFSMPVNSEDVVGEREVTSTAWAPEETGDDTTSEGDSKDDVTGDVLSPVDSTELVKVDSLIGANVEGYQVIECLGEGGFARVYRAVHVGVGQEVALKVLLAQLPGSNPERRLEREGLALAQLEHPNLIKVFNVGALHDGRPYFAMELLRGETLNDALSRTPKLPEERVVSIVRQLAVGLSAIHRANLVHRDLGPRNIMLVPTPQGELVKILDLGIARFLDPEAGFTRLTRPGATLGTVRWMAPEQIEDPHSVKGPADLYTLGLLFHSMLNGFPTYNGIDRPPPPPLSRGADFEPLISALLQKAPEDRPTVDSLIESLDLIVPPPPLESMVTVPPLEASPKATWVMLAGALVSFICLGILAWHFSQSTESQARPRRGSAIQIQPKPTKVTARPAPRVENKAVSPRKVRTPPSAPRKTTPRKRVGTEGATLSKSAMRAQIRRHLKRRGLRFKDILGFRQTRPQAELWRTAIRGTDDRARAQAHTSFLGALERLVLEPAFVRRRLEEVRGRLAQARGQTSKRRLATLERRYLDIRTALTDRLSDAQCAKLLLDIGRLERDILGA